MAVTLGVQQLSLPASCSCCCPLQSLLLLLPLLSLLLLLPLPSLLPPLTPLLTVMLL